MINEHGDLTYKKRLPNDLPTILHELKGHNHIESIVVELTYNGYWLVDGLQEAGYAVRLANTTAIRKASKSNRTVAVKTVAHKLARACFYLMRDGVAFDVNLSFWGWLITIGHSMELRIFWGIYANGLTAQSFRLRAPRSRWVTPYLLRKCRPTVFPILPF